MDFLKYYNVLAYISAYSVIIPLALAFQHLKKGTRALKIIFIYLSLSLLTELVNMFYLLRSESNIIVGAVFKLAELFLITYFFQLAAISGKKNIIILILSLTLAVLFFAADLFYGSTILYNGFSHCMIIVLSIVTFYKMLNSDHEVVDFTSDYLFWFNCAFILYFGASFFVFLFDDLTRSFANNVARFLWTIQLFVNLIYYVILSIGIWKVKIR